MHNYSEKTKKTILLLLALFFVVFVVFIGFRVYSDSRFRAVNISPDQVLPTSTTQITITFNRELKNIEEQNNNSIGFEPELRHETAVVGNTLIIGLLEQPEKDSTFRLTINNLLSIKNEPFSKTLDYKVEYVPFGKLSEQEQLRQTLESTTPEDRHPLLDQLPYDAITYRIEYLVDETVFGTANTWQEEKGNFVVNIYTFAANDGVPFENYVATTTQFREDAKDWIKTTGVDPDQDILINYFPSDEELSGSEDLGD